MEYRRIIRAEPRTRHRNSHIHHPTKHQLGHHISPRSITARFATDFESRTYSRIMVLTRHENTPCRHSFTTRTLVSKTHFGSRHSSEISRFTLGLVWRVAFPSHFGRYMLFCDFFVPSSTDPTSTTRVWRANVHLDYLPIRPSHRPRQLSIVSSFLRSAGCGLVAGDFNPVLDEDAALVETNGLTDAWIAIRPEEPGYTWGADGKQRFLPNRMDKVAMLGLKARGIEILEARRLGELDGQRDTQSDTNVPESQTQPTVALWGDHHGLLCSFGLGE